MAVANYHDTHGAFPPAYLADGDGRPMHSWRVLILPYIEQDKLYKEYDFSEPWDGPRNRTLAARMPRTYALHGTHEPGQVVTNYLAVAGPGTLWDPARRVRFQDITDGKSNTILIAENFGAEVHWMEPRDLDVSDPNFRVGHPHGPSYHRPRGGPAVAMVDSSVLRLSLSLTPGTLRALSTHRGGEHLGVDEQSGWVVLPRGRFESEPGAP